jgi:hypothetical protein
MSDGIYKEPRGGASELDIPALGERQPAYRQARQPARIDPASRRLALTAAGIGGVLLLLFAVWSFSARRPQGVPVIEADSRPLRVKPANPGGMQVAGADEAILSNAPGADTVHAGSATALAPAAEVPQPQALLAPPAAKPAPQAMIPPAAPPAAVAPVHAANVTPARKPASGRTEVQLAALTSEAAASAQWSRLAHLLPDAFAGRHPIITSTEHGGHRFWRLRTGGFADTAQAGAFCNRLRAKGMACAIADF